MARPIRPLLRKAGRVVGIVAVNVLLFVSLVVTTNIVSGVLLSLSRDPSVTNRLHSWFGMGRPPLSNTARLPPYGGDEKRAREIWREMERARRVDYEPFVEWQRKAFHGTWVNVSESGDRMYEAPSAPPAGAPIVRFFGGSSMWGTGVADSETIPAVYTRQHPQYRVFNHGETAFNSRQNLERLINLIATGNRTDVAVFYEGFNDVITLCREDTQLNGHGDEDAMRGILDRAWSVQDLFYGRTVSLLRRVLAPASIGYLCAAEPERARGVVQTVLNVWKAARTLQERDCGRLVVVLQPVAVLGSPRVDYMDDEPDLPNSLDRAESAGRELKVVYPLLQKEIARERAGGQGDPWIHDATDAYDGDEPIYVDIVHAARRGNEIMAQRFAPLVERALADVRRCRARVQH